MTTSVPDKIQAFNQHGFDLTKIGEDEYRGDCFLCGKEKHFFVKGSTGQWQCKVCAEAGNLTTALNKLHTLSVQHTNTPEGRKALDVLAKDRKLSSTALRNWGVAVSITTGEFIVPHYNAEGKFANLSRIIKVPDNKKESGYAWKIYATKTLFQHPFGMDAALKNKKKATTMYIPEGFWDGVAFPAGPNEIVLAVPGCGSVNVKWFKPFTSIPKWVLCFDNDHPRKMDNGKTITPGWDGTQRVIQHCVEQSILPQSLYTLKWGKTEAWDTELTDGYDIRDLVNQVGSKSARKFIDAHVTQVALDTDASPSQTTEKIKPVECSDFEDLVSTYKQDLHVTLSMRNCLAISLAAVVSTRIPGEQLWIRLIGPPGSGKTTIAEALSVATEYIYPQSIITGFHSGWTGTRGKKDSGLIHDMNGKMTIIKDGDTLLSSANLPKILAELRDLYDGTSRARYRTGLQHTYTDLRMTFMFCGTDALRGLNRSFLGERFLDAEILAGEETDPFVTMAIDKAFRVLNPSTEVQSASTIIKAKTYGFLLHLMTHLDNRKSFTLSDSVRVELSALSMLLSQMRARVQRERDEMTYRPRAELATRIGGQLSKLAVCLAYVLHRETIDNSVMAIVRKMVHDTSNSFHYELCRELSAPSNKDGCSAGALARKLQIAETTVRRTIADLTELKIIQNASVTNASGTRGRNTHLHTLTPKMLQLFIDSKLRKSLTPLSQKKA